MSLRFIQTEFRSCRRLCLYIAKEIKEESILSRAQSEGLESVVSSMSSEDRRVVRNKDLVL